MNPLSTRKKQNHNWPCYNSKLRGIPWHVTAFYSKCPTIKATIAWSNILHMTCSYIWGKRKIGVLLKKTVNLCDGAQLNAVDRNDIKWIEWTKAASSHWDVNLGPVKDQTFWCACHPALCPVGCVGATLRWCSPSLSPLGGHHSPTSRVSKGGVSWRRQTDLLWSPLAHLQWDAWASADSVSFLGLSTECSWRTCHELGILLGLRHRARRTEKQETWFLDVWFAWVPGPQHATWYSPVDSAAAQVQGLRATILETNWPGVCQAHSQCLACRLSLPPPTKKKKNSRCVVERRKAWEQLKPTWVEPVPGSLEVCEFRRSTGPQS